LALPTTPDGSGSSWRGEGGGKLPACPAAKTSASDGLIRRQGTVVPLKRRGPLIERISFGLYGVYLDDIQEIFSILREIADEVRIQADDFVATEPQDLLDISSDTINELTIVAT
jgi:hypothetical protein